MKDSGYIALFSLALVWSVQARGVTDEQYQAIQALGMLNGLALPCHYLDQPRRMKKALVTLLPKRRALGDGFDQSTNEAFLKFIEEKRPCPTSDEFEAQVGKAIGNLQQVFPAE
jgi:hypothetical protein